MKMMILMMFVIIIVFVQNIYLFLFFFIKGFNVKIIIRIASRRRRYSSRQRQSRFISSLFIRIFQLLTMFSIVDRWIGRWSIISWNRWRRLGFIKRRRRRRWRRWLCFATVHSKTFHFNQFQTFFLFFVRMTVHQCQKTLNCLMTVILHRRLNLKIRRRLYQLLQK